MAKQLILIGLDTAIGCIIWTAPDYSSPDAPEPIHSGMAPDIAWAFSLRSCVHAQAAIIWIIGQIMKIYKIPMLLALTAEC